MLSSKLYIPIWFFLLIYSVSLNGQILNIESLRIVTDTTGWSGNLGFAVSASKSTKSFFNISTNGHLQRQDTKNLILLVGNIDVVNAGGEQFNNSGFAHLRYNRKVTDLLRLEAFTQVQFNAITKIENRILNGLGIRLKLSQYEKAKFYYGLTFMNEYERLSEPNIINRDNRISTYFTFTLAPEQTVSLSNTTYVQPLIGNINDYRLSNDISLIFKINKHLQLSINFHYLFDSKPPIDVPSVNYQFNNGLTFKF